MPNKSTTFQTSPHRDPNYVESWAVRRRRNQKTVTPHQHDTLGRRNAPRGLERTGPTTTESQSLASVYRHATPEGGGPRIVVSGHTSAPATRSYDGGLGRMVPQYPDAHPSGQTSTLGSALGRAMGNAAIPSGLPPGVTDIHETPQFNAQTRAAARHPQHHGANLNDILSAVLSAAQAQFNPTGVSVPSIDVGQVTAPYDQAMQVARSTAEEHKQLINQLNSDQAASVNQWSHEDAARLVRAKAAEIAAQQQAVTESQQNYKDIQQSLVNQGVDPGVVAGIAAQAEVDHKAAKNTGQAAVRQVQDAQGAQSAEAADRARANTTGTREAQASLGDTLMALVTGLSGQKAQAASQAEYTNQQNQASAANAAAQQRQAYMGQVADLLNSITQGFDSAKGNADTYQTPQRGDVSHWLQRYSADPTHKADDVLRAAIQNAPDEATALDNLKTGISELQKKTKTATNKNGTQVSSDLLANLIHRYYATNGVIRDSAANSALERALAQVKLLGLVQ